MHGDASGCLRWLALAGLLVITIGLQQFREERPVFHHGLAQGFGFTATLWRPQRDLVRGSVVINDVGMVD